MRRASGDVLVGTIVMYVGVGLAHRGTGDGSMPAEQVALLSLLPKLLFGEGGKPADRL